MKRKGVRYEMRAGKVGPWEKVDKAVVLAGLASMFADPSSALFCMIEGGDVIPTPTAYFRAWPELQKEETPSRGAPDGVNVKTINRKSLIYAEFRSDCQGDATQTKGL